MNALCIPPQTAVCACVYNIRATPRSNVSLVRSLRGAAPPHTHTRVLHVRGLTIIPVASVPFAAPRKGTPDPLTVVTTTTATLPPPPFFLFTLLSSRISRLLCIILYTYLYILFVYTPIGFYDLFPGISTFAPWPFNRVHPDAHDRAHAAIRGLKLKKKRIKKLSTKYRVFRKIM